MAIKLFCSKCQGFIKDIKPKEYVPELDTAICPECERRIATIHDGLRKTQSQFIHRVNTLYDKSVAELETLLKNVEKPEGKN